MANRAFVHVRIADATLCPVISETHAVGSQNAEFTRTKYNFK